MWVTLYSVLLTAMIGPGRFGNEAEAGGDIWHPLDCMNSRASCMVDTHCKMMLNAIPDVCPSPDKCNLKRRQDCQAVQRWLQLTPVFRDCHCRLGTPELSAQCDMLKSSIYEDPCPHISPAVQQEKNKTKPETKERERDTDRFNRRRSKEKFYVPDTTEDDYYDYDNDADEDYYEQELSCIGVRKNCLTDHTFPNCVQAFHDFRRLCRENKKRNECVASDIEGCFNVIHKLKPSGIYDCNCNKIDRSRELTYTKCERIQYRLANNTCLVTVPYLIHSIKNIATSYEVVKNIVASSSQLLLVNQQGRTCLQAFMTCDVDSVCRNRMAAYLKSCQWNIETHRCNRDLCLQDIRQFYRDVKQHLSHALLFCRCDNDDYRCGAVRQALYPTCSTIEMPPPACHRLVERCEIDPDCRQRWYDYEDYCRYDKISNGCASGSAMCRSAQQGIMGTILTANCTCALLDGMEAVKCKQAAWRLHEESVCKDLAIMDFQKMQRSTIAPSKPWQDFQHKEEFPRGDCLRQQLDNKIPHFMAVPTYIRLYRNDSSCSDLCECRDEGHTMTCRRLPCPSPQNCREHQMSYAHGSGFVRPDRGQCRCIKGEVVCARPLKSSSKQRSGLYLHVGYSVSDRHLLEGHSAMKFDLASINRKLGALLNGDPAEQFCKITIFHHEEGNVVFEVKLAPYRQSDDLRKVCESPTQRVSYMINNRQSVVITDAELSVLKVAEMELLQRIGQPKPSSDEPNFADSKFTSIAGSTGAIIALSHYVTLLLIINIIGLIT